LNINEKAIRNAANNTLTTANEKFNLIVLSNIQQRFELLPIINLQNQASNAQVPRVPNKSQMVC
jgi:hypothetical protein